MAEPAIHGDGDHLGLEPGGPIGVGGRRTVKSSGAPCQCLDDLGGGDLIQQQAAAADEVPAAEPVQAGEQQAFVAVGPRVGSGVQQAPCPAQAIVKDETAARDCFFEMPEADV